MDEILDLFREEANEHLAALEKGFLDLERDDSGEARGPLIDRLFRHAHGLKGAARAVELFDIQDRAQQLEDTLDQLREDPETVTGEAIEKGLAQLDELRNVFQQWQRPESSANAAQTVTPAAPSDAAEDVFTVRVSSDRLDRMLSLAGELRISQRAADLHAKKLAAFKEILAESPVPDSEMPMDVRQPLESMIGDWRSAMLDQIERIQAEFHTRQVREELLLRALEGDIQEARLLPLSMLAESLRRPVRDLAQSLGKSIRFEVDVGSVLLDKAVIEALRDPLLHMIRNAAHHGIETPQERDSAGKPEEGCILLRAARCGDRVYVEVGDDGRGVDFERIRQRVRQTGGLEASDIPELGERELGEYLFRAGFTTAAQADEISGRGVGLDVVSNAVRSLHGSVELLPSSDFQLPIEGESAIGNRQSAIYSTVFRISVPVTISTVRILTVACGGQYYGIPSSSIVRTARVRPDELRELEDSLILTVDEQPVPWVMLADLVGLPRAPLRREGRATAGTAAKPGNGPAIPYVLTAHENKRLAIGVDDMEDESEVILKPLGFPLTGMPGILGGTVRPDGSVQIVLDVARDGLRPQRSPTAASVEPAEAAARILVVDDSPTTRTILRNVLATAGYSVHTAADGVDALERLRYQPVDLVVTDVQMPRMNGFELTRQLKLQFGLPVILVTGMEKEEQRREGLAAGADAYVVKSTFQGKGLLEIVKQFV
jgi:two-component system chemotaxis sensor kinase CheA